MSILSSEYAELFGLPLSLFGASAYAAVLGLSVWASGNADAAGRTAQLGVLGGSTVLATSSAYLMYLLAAKVTLHLPHGDASPTRAPVPQEGGIHPRPFACSAQFNGELCAWCIGSATLSAAIASLALPAGLKRRPSEASGSIGVGLAATVAALALGGPSFNANAAVSELPYQEPYVDTESPAGAVELARDLRANGAKMYGAFW